MGYIDMLLLFSSLPWHLVVVPEVVAPTVGCAADKYQGQFSSFVLSMALVYPCSYYGVGELRLHALLGWFWPGMLQSPCAAYSACMHTPA